MRIFIMMGFSPWALLTRDILWVVGVSPNGSTTDALAGSIDSVTYLGTAASKTNALMASVEVLTKLASTVERFGSLPSCLHVNVICSPFLSKAVNGGKDLPPAGGAVGGEAGEGVPPKMSRMSPPVDGGRAASAAAAVAAAAAGGGWEFKVGPPKFKSANASKPDAAVGAGAPADGASSPPRPPSKSNKSPPPVDGLCGLVCVAGWLLSTAPPGGAGLVSRSSRSLRSRRSPPLGWWLAVVGTSSIDASPEGLSVVRVLALSDAGMRSNMPSLSLSHVLPRSCSYSQARCCISSDMLAEYFSNRPRMRGTSFGNRVVSFMSVVMMYSCVTNALLALCTALPTPPTPLPPPPALFAPPPLLPAAPAAAVLPMTDAPMVCSVGRLSMVSIRSSTSDGDTLMGCWSGPTALPDTRRSPNSPRHHMPTWMSVSCVWFSLTEKKSLWTV
mmetsp:Transcript_34206/g.98477  ORF Transcript_34206/g.98477 Transcript_34206/m.98477 type:complete len:444 (-) Transcript_34206:1510-2841(-)